MTKKDNAQENLSYRLGEAIRVAGGSSAVARLTGIPLRSLTRYINEGVEPSATTLGQIAKAIGVGVDELLFGKSDAPVDTSVAGGGESDPDLVQVPLLGVLASAGAGSLNWGAEIIDRLPFSRTMLRRLGVNPDRVEFIQARGDSMEPTIKDGANVLIDRSKKDIREDAVYAISIADEVRLKRIRRNFDGSLTLISDNKDFYPEERLPPVDTEHLKVHGRVFWTEKLL